MPSVSTGWSHGGLLSVTVQRSRFAAAHPLTPTPLHILLSALYLAQAGSGAVTRHAGLAYDGNYPPSSPRLSESADNSLPGDSSAKLATADSQRRLVNHTTLGVSDLAGVVFTCLGAGDKGAQSLAL